MSQSQSTNRPGITDCKWDRESWEMVLRGDPNGWMRRHAQLIDADEIAEALRDLLRRRGEQGAPETIDAYTHFSYCRKTCTFCMYWHQVPGRLEQYDEYAQHLAGLCERFGSAAGHIEVSNAYFGGGTPSAMPTAGLTHFLRAFRNHFSVGREFTSEAHPNTLDAQKLEAFLEAGVNRFSMGLQSLNPGVLKVINRNNRPREEVADLVRVAQNGGATVNLDLCLGLPTQTLPSIQSDLRDVLSFRPDGITVYRYHPVPSLPVPVPEGMNYDALFDGPMRADIEAAGYRLIYDAKRSTAKLFSRDPQSKQRIEEIESGGRSQHRGETRGDHGYAQFSWEPSSIIGLGPGAYTHLYGRFWVREVTKLDGLGAGSKPVYWGARISLEDEVRIAALKNINRNKPLLLDQINAFSGIDLRDMFGELIRDLDRDGVLHWLGDNAFKLKPHVDDATVREISERIAPFIKPPRSLNADERARVQPQLVIDPDRGGGGGGKKRVSMVEPWSELLQIPGVGRRFLRARVELTDDRSVHFACGIAGSAPLRVFVYEATEERVYSKSRRFALSYGSRPDQPMTDRERIFLEALAQRTRDLDP